jgi:hypothetical protein
MDGSALAEEGLTGRMNDAIKSATERISLAGERLTARVSNADCSSRAVADASDIFAVSAVCTVGIALAEAGLSGRTNSVVGSSTVCADGIAIALERLRGRAKDVIVLSTLIGDASARGRTNEAASNARADGVAIAGEMPAGRTDAIGVTPGARGGGVGIAAENPTVRPKEVCTNQPCCDVAAPAWAEKSCASEMPVFVHCGKGKRGNAAI